MIVANKLLEKPFKRPWQTPIPPLEVEEINGIPVDAVTIACPSDDGNTGLVTIGWSGPPVTNHYTCTAIDALLDYLADTSVSPLQRDLIQIPDPYCASIETQVEQYSETCTKISFSGTKVDKLKLIWPRLVTSLKRIVDGGECHSI